MGTVILADVSELETIKISELAETLSTGVHDVIPVVKDGKTQKVKKPNLVHTQNTDTKLDEGGANEIDVTEIPKMATSNITYYVATDGDDSNLGTDAEPFATIQHAVDLTPKILNGYYAIIRLKDGDYDEGIIDIANFIDGEIYIYSDSWDADKVVINVPVIHGEGFAIDFCSAFIYIAAVSVRIQKNYGRCFNCTNSSNVELVEVKVGDDGNTSTIGINANGSIVGLESVSDIDANKVAIGIDTRFGGLAIFYSTNPFGDTFTNVTYGGIITDSIILSKADYDDAITKKHTQNTDTALGAQSENLDMNIHKIINVVDPVNNQDVITKLFASNMAINGGIF